MRRTGAEEDLIARLVSAGALVRDDDGGGGDGALGGGGGGGPADARPVLLDVCCCAGGAARGYQRAGFRVVGIDIVAQPNYVGDSFVRADAIEALDALVAIKAAREGGSGWQRALRPAVAAVHASPPCQAHSDLQKQSKRTYIDLIEPVRVRLRLLGVPYVIENVEGAPLLDPVRICGANSEVFPSLRVIRHRLFETNWPLVGVPCPARHPLVFTYDKRKAHYGNLDQSTAYVQVTGGGNATKANKLAAMCIDWPMTSYEVNEAIPPLYTQHVGAQLREHLAGSCGHGESYGCAPEEKRKKRECGWREPEGCVQTTQKGLDQKKKKKKKNEGDGEEREGRGRSAGVF